MNKTILIQKTLDQLSESLNLMKDSLLSINRKHIVCYSGGHSSARVAIAVAKRFGAENTILLNHDISEWVESSDIKRFKLEVSNYIGVPITYANIKDLPIEEIPDQFDVVVEAAAFKVGTGSELCTSRLKTEPFSIYLKNNFPDKNCVIYYGFDKNETARIQRRSGILGQQGYKTNYPIAFGWNEVIDSTVDIGINPPMQYQSFKHANCIGCLKAGKQHWYVVYCTRPDVYKKAKWAEDEIGYTIVPGNSLDELEPLFEEMKKKNIPQTEHIPFQTFWADVRKKGIKTKIDKDNKPCECII